MKHSSTLSQRFFANVRKTESCWLWIGGLHNKGYGVLWHPQRKRCILAHRISYELHFGPIDDTACVLHHCDNPPCVNPVHLFLGTRLDNMIDKMLKGRSNVCKLSVDQVTAIRQSKLTCRELATRFGVSFQNISQIRRFDTRRYC